MSRRTEDWNSKEVRPGKPDAEESEREEPVHEKKKGEAAGRKDGFGGIPVSTGTTAAVFCGLVALAAVICGILWYLTHSGRGGDNDGNSLAGTESTFVAEESGSGFQEPGSGGTDAGPEGVEGGSASQEPGSESTDAGPEGVEGGSASQEPGSESTDAGPEGVEGGSASGEPGSGGTDAGPEGVEGSSASREPGSGGTDAGPEGVEGSSASREPEGRGSGSSQEPGSSGSSSAPADPNRVSTLDGRVIVFADCDDTVTPKIYVNLRTEPSTSEGESTVYGQIRAGTWVHRTGISEDSGWSRVEWDGTVCYVVSSYVIEVGTDGQ